MFKRLPFISSMAVLMAVMSFNIPNQKYPSRSNLTIQFENYVGSDLLKLDSTVYINTFGQKYTVSRLKYYVSNIRLKKKDGKDYIAHEYFIVNEDR